VTDNFSFPVSLAARRYAGALFEVAVPGVCLDETAKIVDSLAVLLEKSADFRRFIASPLYNADAQERVMAALAKSAGLDTAKGAGNIIRCFLGVLAQHRRLFLLPDIITAFQAQMAANSGEIAVFITSAEEISASQQQELLVLLARAAANEKIGKYFAGKKPVLHKRIKPELLGGFILRCGSLLIDTSLRTKLSALKLALKEIG